MLLFLLVFGVSSAHAEFPSSFPPNDPRAIEEIVSAFEQGRVPYYESPARLLPGDDEVEVMGQPAGILASLQLHARHFKPNTRKAMVEAIARLTVAIFDLGARGRGSGDMELEDARLYLSNILRPEAPDEVDFNAIRVLVGIANGKRLKASSETARAGLRSIAATVENILLQKDVYKNLGSINNDDVETMMALLLQVDELAGLATLKKIAESKLHYAPLAKETLFFGLWEKDANRAWRLCHETLVELAEKKAAK